MGVPVKVVITALLLLAASAAHADQMLTKTYKGDMQACNGGDQLLLARKPWHPFEIRIKAVSLTHRVFPPTDMDFAMVGSSGPEGDILIHAKHEAQNFVLPGNGVRFEGSPSAYHLDVHAWCAPGSRHEVWLTVFYSFPDGVPVTFVEADNDKLPEFCRTHSEYCPQPPKRRGFAGFVASLLHLN
jgi:hypothetical protein